MAYEFGDSKTITGQNFSDYMFSEKSFRQFRFIKCNFTNAKFLNADLSGSLFLSCNLDGARFDYSVMTRVRFKQCRTAPPLSMNFADLREASFSKVNLKNVTLNEAELQDATFAGSDLSGGDLSDAIVNNGTVFNRCTLNDTNWSNVEINRVIITPKGTRDIVHRSVAISERKDAATGCLGSVTFTIWRFLASSRPIVFFVLFLSVAGLFSSIYAWPINDNNETMIKGIKAASFYERLLPAIYFEIATVSTVGYGDYSPRSELWYSHVLVAVNILTMYFLLLAAAGRMANWLRVN